MKSGQLGIDTRLATYASVAFKPQVDMGNCNITSPCRDEAKSRVSAVELKALLENVEKH